MTRQWRVFTQSQYPAFQMLLERLSIRYGDCTLHTGTPFDINQKSRLNTVTAPSYDQTSVKSRMLSWSRYLLSAEAAFLRTKKKDIFFVTTNPPFLPHLSLLQKHIRGNRYAILIWDIYPEHVVQMGWMKSANPIIRLWKRLNRAALLNSDLVITLSETMAETILRQMGEGGRRPPVEVIPNWTDTEKITPISRSDNSLAKKIGLENTFNVLYAGNIGGTHDLASIIPAAAHFKDDSRIRFVIVGSGLGRKALEEDVKRRDLRNVILMDKVSWEEVPEMLAIGDLAVVAQSKKSAHLSMPSKTISALAAGSAILALTPENSDLARLVNKNEVGVVCDNSDVEQIVTAIRQLLHDPACLERYQRNAREIAVDQFSVEAAVKRYESSLGMRLLQEAGVSAG